MSYCLDPVSYTHLYGYKRQITIQALAAMVGAGTADTSPTGTTPVAVGAGAVAPAAAGVAAGACWAQAGNDVASIADNTAPAKARRAKTTGE